MGGVALTLHHHWMPVQLMVPNHSPRELYSDKPSDRHSSKENSVTRSSGDRCSAGSSGCQSGTIREHLDEPLRGTFFRANVRIKTNSIRVPVQSREKFLSGTSGGEHCHWKRYHQSFMKFSRHSAQEPSLAAPGGTRGGILGMFLERDV